MKRCFLCLLALGLLGITACDSKPGPSGAVTGMAPSNPNNPVVAIETSMGTITAELFQDKSPITVKNFLAYVDDGFYGGTIFHRVIPEFMIQGGGYEPGMKEKKTREPIKNESDNGLLNQRGTLAMARTDRPDSATAQFFINTVDNPGLDRARAEDGVGYCVFGKVLSGMDVLNQIENVPTGRQFQEMEINAKTFRVPHDNVPRTDVLIKSIRRR